MPALDVRHLTKIYHAGLAGCSASARALVDVSLQARPGEVVGVWGGVGAGKTTLLLCAAAALRPDGGEVRWFGRLASASARAGSGVAYVAACPAHHAFLTARQSLEYAAHGRRGAARPRRAGTSRSTVLALIRRAGLEGDAGRRVRELPAGPRRGLALAHALVERPRLLLVDDPFDDLDAEWAAAHALLVRAVAADGVACVVTARDYAALRTAADRVVTLAGGQVAAAAAVDAGRAAAQGDGNDARRTRGAALSSAGDAARVAEPAAAR